jgi:hypothetical protein
VSTGGANASPTTAELSTVWRRRLLRDHPGQQEGDETTPVATRKTVCIAFVNAVMYASWKRLGRRRSALG